MIRERWEECQNIGIFRLLSGNTNKEIINPGQLFLIFCYKKGNYREVCGGASNSSRTLPSRAFKVKGF